MSGNASTNVDAAPGASDDANLDQDIPYSMLGPVSRVYVSRSAWRAKTWLQRQETLDLEPKLIEAALQQLQQQQRDNAKTARVQHEKTLDTKPTRARVAQQRVVGARLRQQQPVQRASQQQDSAEEARIQHQQIPDSKPTPVQAALQREQLEAETARVQAARRQLDIQTALAISNMAIETTAATASAANHNAGLFNFSGDRTVRVRRHGYFPYP